MIDFNGFTVLHWLASNGRTQLLNEVLALGLCCDVVDVHGQVCVDVCIGVSNYFFIYLLLIIT